MAACTDCKADLHGATGPLCAACAKKQYDAAEALRNPATADRTPPSGTENFAGVEVFATGTHNGDTYTEKDLDAMADAHRVLGAELKPFVKLGHSKDQSIVQADGFPAAGWVDNVRREGGKLLADFKAVPHKLADIIRKGGYRRVSSEVLWNLKRGTDTFPRVLKAVALLGATTPAVRSLKDIHDLYYGSADAARAYEVSESDPGADLRIYEIAPKEDETVGMTAEEAKRMDDLLAQNKQYEAQEKARGASEAEAIAKAKAEAEQRAAEAETAKAEAEKRYAASETARKAAEDALKSAEMKAQVSAADAEIDGLLRDGVKAGKVLPKHVAIFKALAMTDLIAPDAEGVREYAYKDNGKDAKVAGTVRSLVKDLIASMPRQIDFSERAKAGGIPRDESNGGEVESHYAETGEKAREYQAAEAKKGRVVTLKQAAIAVSRMASAGRG